MPARASVRGWRITAEMRKKTVVKVDEAKKTLEILEGGRKRILTDGGRGDGVAQEGESGLGENALGKIDPPEGH